METLQAEGSLQEILVCHKLLPKGILGRKRAKITRNLVLRMLKYAGLFVATDQLTRGRTSETFVCALVVQCVV